MNNLNNWFEEWFNTHYYHLLYIHRSDQEAQAFIHNIIEKHNWKSNSYILDLACGKGRHSNFLASQGMHVLGVDLSEENIKIAQKQAVSNCEFKVGDMRHIPHTNTFDMVVNLFTSFGYFEEKDENTQVLREVFKSLKPGGTFLFDYLNPPYVHSKLHTTNSVYYKDIVIKTKKKIEGEWVVKQIDIMDGNTHKLYYENVHLLEAKWIKEQLEAVGFEIVSHYGNYQLHEFIESKSPRSIFVAKKPN